MLIFGTGVVTGGLLVGSIRLRDRPPARPAGPNRSAQPAVSAGAIRLDFLKRMEGELDLNPEQRERIDEILKNSLERARKFITPRIREEAQRSREEFLQVLTPEQRARFDELWKQQLAKGKKAPPSRERSTNAAPSGAP